LALKNLGGSGYISEIYEKVIELEEFDEETVAIPHALGKDNRTKIEYNLAWARTYLKKAGYLENSSRGVWTLTDRAWRLEEIDSQKIIKKMRSFQRGKTAVAEPPDGQIEHADFTPAEDLGWREKLHHILVEKMSPAAFERLTQQMLHESGFVQVEVTGRTGDGGIDGKGIACINGLLNFHIAFQCKKYKSSVSVEEIRNFRGAIVGRTDRGMFITTGSFTKAARDEANRDGAAPIDLVDGEQLADKLKELALGIKKKPVEYVKVENEWFLNL